MGSGLRISSKSLIFCVVIALCCSSASNMEQPADTGGPAGVAAVAALQPDRSEVPVVAQPPSGVSQPPPLELGLAGATSDSPTFDLGDSDFLTVVDGHEYDCVACGARFDILRFPIAQHRRGLTHSIRSDEMRADPEVRKERQLAARLGLRRAEDIDYPSVPGRTRLAPPEYHPFSEGPGDCEWTCAPCERSFFHAVVTPLEHATRPEHCALMEAWVTRQQLPGAAAARGSSPRVSDRRDRRERCVYG